MAETSEFTEFRRAFVWLLCGVLLPSVALVAFGVVAVANERAAVERRLAEEYDARLQLVERALDDRLAAAARAAAAGAQDPLIASVRPVEAPDSLDAATRKSASLLPIGGFLLGSADSGGDRRVFAVVRSVGLLGDRLLQAQLNTEALAAEAPALGQRRFPKERATFRLVAPRETRDALAALRRIMADVAPGQGSVVARLPLGPPLEGFVLAAELAGDDPAATLTIRNRSVYIALLVLLYGGIGVGFGLTLREMRRAYKLSRLKTDFVANISHELRTPLTSVRLFAETLREGRAETPEEVQECVELLSNEAERLSKLVEKLLDWSRLESGRRPLQKQSTPVPELVKQIGEAYRAQQLPATYRTELEPGLPAVSVDRDALAQAVLNLLHNAVKYTGEDKQIVLRARRAGEKVAIEVQDNGSGVQPHDRKKIFERFYRADNLLSRKTEGTGLGLAIAKKIVEAHGGRIELDSRLGEGSTFRVLLPAEA